MPFINFLRNKQILIVALLIAGSVLFAQVNNTEAAFATNSFSGVFPSGANGASGYAPGEPGYYNQAYSMNLNYTVNAGPGGGNITYVYYCVWGSFTSNSVCATNDQNQNFTQGAYNRSLSISIPNAFNDFYTAYDAFLVNVVTSNVSIGWNVGLNSRIVLIDSFDVVPSSVNVGDAFFVSWDPTNMAAAGGTNLSVSGPASCPSGPVSSPVSCVATGAGTATLTLKATGAGLPNRGANGPISVSSEKTVNVNQSTHLECVSNTCAEVSGAGDNLGGCTTAGASCGGGGRLKCQNNACVFDPNDSGPNQCSINSDCGGGSCVSDGSCSAPAPACGTTTTGTDNCGATCSKTGPACGGGGTGTVRIIANTNDGYFVDGPGADDWGWNGSADFPGHPTGTYSVNAPGGSSSPASATLFSGETIIFTVTFGGPPPPSPTPPPPSASISSCTVNVLSPPEPNQPSGVSVAQPNYCLSGPAAITSWTYSDPTGSPQSAYQVQIDNQGSFSSLEYDSGKVFCSSCRSNSTSQGLLQFNMTYKARVRVWNGFDQVSGWTESNSFKTPNFAYPQVNFTFSPLNPPSNSQVQFIDQTQFFDGNPNGRRWSWIFGDGGTSTQQNPQNSFASEGTFNTTLTATDNANQSCSITKPINVQKPNPIWKEVNPGG